MIQTGNLSFHVYALPKNKPNLIFAKHFDMLQAWDADISCLSLIKQSDIESLDNLKNLKINEGNRLQKKGKLISFFILSLRVRLCTILLDNILIIINMGIL